MSGLVLRLSAPMQSWGEHSAFARRETQRFPTRSGMIGLFANALGLPRTAPLDRFAPLRFTVRVDRPGVSMMDFHTVGGGMPPHKALPTAEGGRRPAGSATLVSRRYYLADAAFTVAVEGPADTVAEIADALAHPQRPLYLGRRSCPPDHPLLLKRDVPDPVADLRERVPVPAYDNAGVDHRLELVYEGDIDDAETITELDDVPVSFSPLDRRHTRRSIASRFESLPTALWTGRGAAHLQKLSEYAGGTT